jgi:ligand-binding sensor protein/putative methionine-R-sulfoxide reductase with GAF domain
MESKDKEKFGDLPRLSFKDLIDIREWQKMQDKFSAVTEVSLRTVDTEGEHLSTPSRENRLCAELLKDAQHKNALCGLCLPTFLGGQGVVDRNLSFCCHAGLYNFVAPLRLDKNKILGYIVLGPVILVMRKSKEEYRKAAEELGLDLENFWSAILELKVISFQGVQSLIALIKDVAENAVELAYRAKMEAKEILTIDAVKSKLRGLLDILLDVAFEISGADIGSIMFMDKDTDTLSIQASRGIPDEVVKNTRVKVGEGISGMAAERGESLLIDDDISDNRIRPYLRRPYISSAMVLPLKIENRVVGVMNLGALKTSAVKFDSENLSLMNRLADLATVAIHS